MKLSCLLDAHIKPFAYLLVEITPADMYLLDEVYLVAADKNNGGKAVSNIDKHHCSVLVRLSAIKSFKIAKKSARKRFKSDKVQVGGFDDINVLFDMFIFGCKENILIAGILTALNGSRKQIVDDAVIRFYLEPFLNFFLQSLLDIVRSQQSMTGDFQYIVRKRTNHISSHKSFAAQC